MADKKLPSFQFYPGDWRKDPGVQSLTYHDRGVWWEMILLMHESPERGKLVLNGRAMEVPELARILGIDPLTVSSTVDTLLACGVAGRDTRSGAIMCRRIVRDEEVRKKCVEGGKRGGNPALCKEYNRPGFVYAAQRASDGAVKIGISESPSKRLYRIRYQMRQPVELLAFMRVEDMGKSEALLHDKYKHAASGEWFKLTAPEIEELVLTLKGKSVGTDKGSGNDKPTPSSSSSVSSSDNTPCSPPVGGLGLRVARWFRRREPVVLSPKEDKALKAVEKLRTPTEDVDLLETYYKASIPKECDYRRRDMVTLLNNWNGEIDRARDFKPIDANSSGSNKPSVNRNAGTYNSQTDIAAISAKVR